MADLNQNTVVVEYESDSFTFRIPSLRDEARISTVVQALIAEDQAKNATEVGVGGDQIGGALKESSLDNAGQFAYRTLAVFKTMLVSTSAKWAYIEDPKSKGPVSNPNLPPQAMEVYVKYLSAISEFFRGGASNSDATS